MSTTDSTDTPSPSLDCATCVHGTCWDNIYALWKAVLVEVSCLDVSIPAVLILSPCSLLYGEVKPYLGCDG